MYNSLVGLVAFKHGVHNTLTLGIGQKFGFVPEKASCGDKELKMHTLTLGTHLDKLALAITHAFHNRAYIFLGDIDNTAVYGLTTNTVDLPVYYSWSTDHEFISVTSHVFHQNGKVHFAPPADIITVGVVCFADTQRHILH